MEKTTYRSNSKEVREKVREHILDYYEGKNFEALFTNREAIRKSAEEGKKFDFIVEGLRNDIEAVKYGNVSTYQAAKRLVEGGNFLIYYTDVREFLESLHLNNKSGKIFSDDECWKMYKHLLAREIAKILK